MCRSQWPGGLRRRSTAAHLLRLWVRIPPGAWMFVYYECCVLSGRGLCDALITRPEESYRLWYVVECDLETSRMMMPWPTGAYCAKTEKKRSISYSRSAWPRGLMRRSTALAAEIVGSNPTRGMDVCMLWVLCVVRYRSPRRADHSSRGVRPAVVRGWMWSRNLVIEEDLAHWGLLSQKREKKEASHIAGPRGRAA